jgi:TMEM175 potassium channel family protein
MSVEGVWNEGGLNKGRLEALTDGVFAIVLTLLVLDIRVPEIPPAKVSEELMTRLFLLWPKILGYAISFVILGVYWVGHHAIFHYIRRSDRVLLWLNMFFLMAVAFVPFSAALFSAYGRQPTAVRIYGYNQLAAGLCLYAQWWHATRGRRLVDRDLDPRVVRAAGLRILTAPALYTGAIVLAFVQPMLSALIYLLVPLFYMVPGRLDRHWRGGHRHDPSPPRRSG